MRIALVAKNFTLSVTTATLLVACGGSDSPATGESTIQQLSCDESMKSDFRPDADTQVIAVRQYKAGEDYPNPTLENFLTSTAPAKFSSDLCLVTLKVGPGNPGPAGAPSTSEGIGIEVWLPSKATWTKRVVSLGGSGWVGGEELDVNKISSNSITGDVGYRAAPRLASEEAVVTATTDVGKLPGGGAFGLLPDNRTNTVGWENWSIRGLREQAKKTKALTTAYYGTPPKYMYFSGASGGGRQAMKVAQELSEFYDGVLAAVPGVSWSRFAWGIGYPQIVAQRDLGGAAPSAAQQAMMSDAAIASCDIVGGRHLGFILDPSKCRYDPTKDAKLLCVASGGLSTSTDCVSLAQAQAMNKVWYGPTADGSVPDPAIDNGWSSNQIIGQRKWFGIPRGTPTHGNFTGAGVSNAGDIIANTLNDSTMGTASFLNAKGNGQSRYLTLSYAEFNRGFDLAVESQAKWFNINSENPDLSSLKRKGGKLISYTTTTDATIPPQGLMKYYDEVVARQGSVGETQTFFRLYVLPSAMHSVPNINGSTNPAADPPIAQQTRFWENLKNWVENGVAPPVDTLATPYSASRAMTLPLCAYPAKPTYQTGSPFSASSYICQ